MKLGIVGLPNVGKSTLFNAITKAGAESANYPFCTIEPNVGVVAVPDKRLDRLAEMYHPKKKTPAVIEFVDIAGLVKGASEGEGLGNKFLSHIREVDAIVHVVRCFDDNEIVHVEGRIDPVDDADIINLELIRSDLEILDRKIDRTAKAMKGDKTLSAQMDLLQRIRCALNDMKSARSLHLSEEEIELLGDTQLISLKPVIYVANVAEDQINKPLESNPYYQALKEYADAEHASVIAISAQIESELSAMEDDEKAMFMEELGINESGLDRLIKASYSLLGLISFLTAGEDECRAWTIRRGTKAPQAAGKIHSDIQRGFIRAETISFDTLMQAGSMANAKEKGLVRQEGKDYVMQDGDIVLFRFNV